MEFRDTIIVTHPVDKVYKLVAEVDKYPKFIPWVKSADLIKVEGDEHYYKIKVSFGIFGNTFITKDKFEVNRKIDISLVEGPFKYLHSIWHFNAIEEYKTSVDFYINFEFKSALLTKALGKVFLEANEKILDSFMRKLDEGDIT